MKCVRINIYTSVLLIIIYLISAPILFRYYKMIYMFPFFIMGILVRYHWNILMQYKRTIFYACLLLYVVAYYLLWDRSCIFDVDSKRWIFKDNGIVFSVSILRTYLLRYAVGSLASLWIIFGVFQLRDNHVFKKIACYGTLSLELYIIGLYIDRFRFTLDCTEKYLYSIECLFLAVIITFLCILLARLIKRVPAIDFFMFGKGHIADCLLNRLIK